MSWVVLVFHQFTSLSSWEAPEAWEKVFCMRQADSPMPLQKGTLRISFGIFFSSLSLSLSPPFFSLQNPVKHSFQILNCKHRVHIWAIGENWEVQKKGAFVGLFGFLFNAWRLITILCAPVYSTTWCGARVQSQRLSSSDMFYYSLFYIRWWVWIWNGSGWWEQRGSQYYD